ncbi:MAG TPA: metallophosphoesterase [Polyangiaceae bacterium]|nr:metallophosphoesterase [Polyangiaceae bacterium]
MRASSLWSVFLLVACQKAEAPENPAPAQPAQPAPPAHKQVALQDTSFKRPSAERIIAIGDLHGDIRAAQAALRLGGALGPDGHWAGGKLVVVQTGDQLDRADEEPEILELLDRLAAEAPAAGGALYTLNGNHEVMNVQGDFRYVTEDGFRDFAATPLDGLHTREIRSLPSDQQGRAAAFLSGEVVAKRLAQRPVVIQVGDSVFVHGGLLEAHVDYGLGRINRETAQWMQAPDSKPAPAILTEERSPIWLRAYSDGIPPAGVCQELGRVLDRLEAKRLVMGHTVQRQGINSVCRGRAWRIDVGLSRAYGQNPPSVLEISGDTVKVLQGDLTLLTTPAAPSAPIPKPSPSTKAPVTKSSSSPNKPKAQPAKNSPAPASP